MTRNGEAGKISTSKTRAYAYDLSTPSRNVSDPPATDAAIAPDEKMYRNVTTYPTTMNSIATPPQSRVSESTGIPAATTIMTWTTRARNSPEQTSRRVRSVVSSSSPDRVSRSSKTDPATKIGVSNSTSVSWTMKKVRANDSANRWSVLAIWVASPDWIVIISGRAEYRTHMMPNRAAPNADRPTARAPIRRLTRSSSQPNKALPRPALNRGGVGGKGGRLLTNNSPGGNAGSSVSDIVVRTLGVRNCSAHRVCGLLWASRPPFLLEPSDGGQPQQAACRSVQERAHQGRGEVREPDRPARSPGPPDVPAAEPVVPERQPAPGQQRVQNPRPGRVVGTNRLAGFADPIDVCLGEEERPDDCPGHHADPGGGRVQGCAAPGRQPDADRDGEQGQARGREQEQRRGERGHAEPEDTYPDQHDQGHARPEPAGERAEHLRTQQISPWPGQHQQVNERVLLPLARNARRGRQPDRAQEPTER